MRPISHTLQEIQLCGQPLAYINPYAFWGLSILETLRIIGTALRKMPLLPNSSCSLEHLDFSSNLISNYGVIMTGGFCRLKYLSLASNRLTSVPDLWRVALSLTYLGLSENCLESLYKPYPVQFTKLRVLALRNTCLKHISLVNLSMSMLFRLYINGNWITSIEPIDSLNLDIESWNNSDCRLSVTLDENPLHCNDSLAWLYEDLQPADYRTGMYAHIFYRDTSLKIKIAFYEYVTCQSPHQFKGKNILTMCKHSCLIHKLEPMAWSIWIFIFGKP